MKISRILLNFLSFPDSRFQTKAEAIETAMTGNANFPAPIPTIADLSDAITAFSGALSAAQSKDKTKVEVRKDMRAQLETLLVNLAAYVTQVAAGSRTIMVSSGFDVSSDVKNPRILGQLNNFQVLPGANSGEAKLSLDSVDNRTGYYYQYALDPITAESVWVSVYNSHCSITITGLEPLKKYWFRVLVTGTRNQSAQTEAISRTIL
jgi:hypothetical protein